MERRVIRTDDTIARVEVGDGFESWNVAIKARIGQIVPTDDGKEFWCDEEGLLCGDPKLNVEATRRVHGTNYGQPIVGDVIEFEPGDIK